MLLLLAHAACTWFMVGLIWIVQVVHYPLLSMVGRAGYRDYQLAHQKRISVVVLPVMLGELALSAWIALSPPAGLERWAGWAGAGLLLIVWLSTFVLQVPQHRRLEDGFDARAHALLVGTNWIRTVAWSLRGVLALVMIALV
jgi:uncharacterized membrane protein